MIDSVSGHGMTTFRHPESDTPCHPELDSGSSWTDRVLPYNVDSGSKPKMTHSVILNPPSRHPGLDPGPHSMAVALLNHEDFGSNPK